MDGRPPTYGLDGKPVLPTQRDLLRSRYLPGVGVRWRKPECGATGLSHHTPEPAEEKSFFLFLRHI